MPGEFEFIDKYLAPLAGPEGLSLKDDASCIASPVGFDLVVTKDVLNEGIHFRSDDPINSVAHKALAVNVSDCVSKGARPTYYWIGLSLPKNTDETWMSGFAEGLKHAQARYGCSLSGGDTTRTNGPLSISLTLIGLVDTGKMLKRSGARPGDGIYVTGCLGDAAIGLECVRKNMTGTEQLVSAFQKPHPPLEFGIQLPGLATAAADISDGLIADCGHIARESGVSMRIAQDQIPVSEEALGVLGDNPEYWPKIWSGGDDYQIIFTAPVNTENEFEEISKQCKTLVTKIGEVTTGSDVQLLDHQGQIVQVTSGGYEHF